jgi:formylglycine-generating enzyme required for sulfatase activity
MPSRFTETDTPIGGLKKSMRVVGMFRASQSITVPGRQTIYPVSRVKSPGRDSTAPGGAQIMKKLIKLVPLTIAILVIGPWCMAFGEETESTGAGSTQAQPKPSQESSPSSPSKLYEAVLGYFEGFRRAKTSPDENSSKRSRTQRRAPVVAPKDTTEDQSSIDNEIDLVKARIKRGEWDLALLALERLSRQTEGKADSQKIAKLRTMLDQARLESGQSTTRTASAGGEFTNSIGMKLVLIPAGTFMMGSSSTETRRVQNRWNAPEDLLAPEAPAHKVRISRPFLLGKYEVTVRDFSAFIQDTGYRTVAEKQGWGWVYDRGKKHWVKKSGASWRNPGFKLREDHPVTLVTHEDAQAFCKWLSERDGRRYYLPTEAQWEYSARAGRQGTRFPWGNDPPDGKKLNLADRHCPVPWADRTLDDGHAALAPVGSYQPNGFWLYDLSGNVWEMCSNYFKSDEYEGMGGKEVTDPQGPRRGKKKVVRGGNWAFGSGIARNAFRSGVNPSLAVDVLGFRVAATAEVEDGPPMKAAHEMSATGLLDRDGLGLLLTRIRNLVSEGRRIEARRIVDDLTLADGGMGSKGVTNDFIKEVLTILMDSVDDPNLPSLKNSLGMKMIRIPAGSFVMGSSESDIAWAMTTLNQGMPINLENEYPFHKVRISRPFLISATEVTVGQFRTFVKNTGYITDAEDAGGGRVFDTDAGRFEDKDGSSWKDPGWKVTDEQPVTMVSYNDAQAFVEWLAATEKLPYKLPTEAQWEYAARGGIPMAQFPWGDGLPDGGKVNYADRNTDYEWRDRTADDGYKHVAPVASYEPNGYGLYDMAGNVLEWVRDYYGEDYYRYTPEVDPEGPGHGENRVMKGGEWTFGPVNLRCAFRGWSRPDLAFFNSGFRVIVELGVPLKEFHFTNDFLSNEWIPRSDHREVARAVAKEKERRSLSAAAEKDVKRDSEALAASNPPVNGVKILAMTPRSDAKKAGLAPGDIIIEYDGSRDLTSEKFLALTARTRKQKKKPRIVLVREGYEYSVSVAPGFLGITLLDAKVRGPFKRRERPATRERDKNRKKRSKPLNWT